MPQGRRVLAPLPDALSATIFIWAWTTPLGRYTPDVATLLIVLLMEFLMLHATPFMWMATGPQGNRPLRTLLLLALAAFYIYMAHGISQGLDSWWPTAMMIWLVLSKLISIWTRPDDSDAFGPGGAGRNWAVSFAIYFVGLFVAMALPWPLLGLTPDVLPQIGLGGQGGPVESGTLLTMPEAVDGVPQLDGAWARHPELAMGFGLLYFGLVAAFKFWDARPRPPVSTAS